MDHSQDRPVRPFWWLNPYWTFLLLSLIPALSAFQISESAYHFYWKSQKYFDEGSLWLVIQAAACFVIGGFYVQLLLSSRGRRPAAEIIFSAQRIGRLYRVFRYSAWLTLLGYLIWFGVAMHNGVSPSLVFSALRGVPGASYVIRDLMETIPGITTFTQFGMASVTLGVLVAEQTSWKPVRLLLISIVGMAILRALLRGERLAFIELVIPAVLLILRMRWFGIKNARVRALLAFAPVLIVAFLYLIFTITEYSRSWTSFYADREDSLFLFGWNRLVGYYVTALNNGAAFHAHVNLPFPDSTMEWFWKFPGLKFFCDYKSLAGFEPYDQFATVMLEDINPEFNNISGILVVFSDYRHAGGLIVWTLLGAIAVFLYISFVRGIPVGLLLYPMFFIGILEAPRIYYWGSSRAFPSWILLFLVLLMISPRRKTSGIVMIRESVPLVPRTPYV